MIRVDSVTPGHDAWIAGDEEFVAHGFAGGAAEYAKGISQEADRRQES